MDCESDGGGAFLGSQQPREKWSSEVNKRCPLVFTSYCSTGFKI